MMDNTYYIGIDIAKTKFDLAFFNENDKPIHEVFENHKKGFANMMKFLKKKGVKKAHVTLEATNVYWQDAADFFCMKKKMLSSASSILCKQQRTESPVYACRHGQLRTP